jgi:hypothetical protein
MVLNKWTEYHSRYFHSNEVLQMTVGDDSSSVLPLFYIAKHEAQQEHVELPLVLRLASLRHGSHLPTLGGDGSKNKFKQNAVAFFLMA